jgi:hypothetical protein
MYSFFKSQQMLVRKEARFNERFHSGKLVHNGRLRSLPLTQKKFCGLDAIAAVKSAVPCVF